MAGNFSTAFANDIVDMLTGRTPSGAMNPQNTGTGALGSATYIALFSDNLTQADAVVGTGNTELSGNGYSRIQLTSTIFSSAASSGSIANVTTGISWTASGGTLGGAAVESWAIVDGSSGASNILMWCDDPSAITVASGETLTFAGGALVLDVYN